MNPNLVPDVAPTPIPGPEWLFQGLLVFTFVLHALFMNLALGGTWIAWIAQARDREGTGPGTVLAQRLMGINTYAISLAITTGIAPLLFVQILYQQYFYSATILVGWVWLLFLVFLMAGYYAAYAYKFRGAPARGRGGTGWLAIAALLFLAIAMVHVAVNLVHVQPDRWDGYADRPWSILADPAYVPRLLHFFLAALGWSGVVAAWWAVRQVRAGRDVAVNTAIAALAWKWVLWTTILQVIDGFVLLFVMPERVVLGLMRGGAATLVPLTVSVLFSLGLLMMLARTTRPAEKPGLVGGVGATMLLTITVMTVTRHQVRDAYLEPVRSQYTVSAAPQWGNFVLFALLLLVGLATVAYMVRTVLRNPARGDSAA